MTETEFRSLYRVPKRGLNVNDAISAINRSIAQSGSDVFALMTAPIGPDTDPANLFSAQVAVRCVNNCLEQDMTQLAVRQTSVEPATFSLEGVDCLQRGRKRFRFFGPEICKATGKPCIFAGRRSFA